MSDEILSQEIFRRASEILSGEDEAENKIAVPQTDDELWEAVRTYVGIEIPCVKVCEDHVAPFTAFADAYFARSDVAIWESSRGFGGKSVTLAALAFIEAITLGAFVTLLGGSGEQSRRVHSYMRGDDPNMPHTFWKCPMAPTNLLMEDPTQRETKLKNGGAIKALMASQKSVRGPHPQRLRCDEIDSMDIDLLEAAIPQAQEARGIKEHIVFSSTHQVPDGTMGEMKRRARKHGYRYYQWCYRESMKPHGWLSPEMVERKRKVVTKQSWDTEYENQEPSPQSRAIMPEAVEEMFTGEHLDSIPQDHLWLEEPVKVCPKCDFEVEQDEDVQRCPDCHVPLKNATYATGADWAKQHDWTVVVTLRVDCTPMRVVAFYRTQRMSWPYMIAQVDEHIDRYDSFAAHDATGLGNVVADYIENPIDDVTMHGKRRKDMLSDLIAAIERGEIVSPRIDFLYNDIKYTSTDDVFGSGHLPDSLAALALAYYAMGYSGELAVLI